MSTTRRHTLMIIEKVEQMISDYKPDLGRAVGAIPARNLPPATTPGVPYVGPAHSHDAGDITSGELAIERLPVAADGTSSATEIVSSTDSRLSNARTPTPHGSSHAINGSDPLTAAQIGAIQNSGNTPSIQASLLINRPATALNGALFIAIDAGKIYRYSTATGWSETPIVRWSDIQNIPASFAPTAHGSSHASGGSDPLTPAQIGAAARGANTDLTSVRPNWIDLPEQATAPAAPATDTVRLYAEDENGITVLNYSDSTGFTARPLRDLFVVARNQTGTTIARGTVVYISGSFAGTRYIPTIAAASATSRTTLPAMGVAYVDIPNNTAGRVITEGRIDNLNTAASGAIDGQRVLVGTTAGSFTATVPTLPAHTQRLGIVLRSHASQGSMLIDPQAVVTGSTGTDQNTFSIGDATAGTKALRFLAAAGSTMELRGTPTAARVITFPDATGTAALLEQAQTWSGAQRFGTTTRFDGAQTDGSARTIRDAAGGWVRTYGQTGISFEAGGGGLYMTDSTWVRTSGNKGLLGNGIYNTGQHFVERGGTAYQGYVEVPLLVPQIVTGWNGSNKGVIGWTAIDLSSAGVPSAAKGVNIRISGQPSGAVNQNHFFGFSGDNSASAVASVLIRAAQSVYQDCLGPVACNASGQIYYTVVGQQFNNCYLVICGYLI